MRSFYELLDATNLLMSLICSKSTKKFTVASSKSDYFEREQKVAHASTTRNYNYCKLSIMNNTCVSAHMKRPCFKHMNATLTQKFNNSSKRPTRMLHSFTPIDKHHTNKKSAVSPYKVQMSRRMTKTKKKPI